MARIGGDRFGGGSVLAEPAGADHPGVAARRRARRGRPHPRQQAHRTDRTAGNRRCTPGWKRCYRRRNRKESATRRVHPAPAGTGLFASLPALKPGLSYDIDRDFIALSRIASVTNVLVVHPSLGVDTVAELVKLAKARPGQLNYGSGGNGGASHLAGEMFNVLAGVQTVHVPYKGAVLALIDLIAGQLQFIMMNPLAAMPHAKTGRIKVIATTGAKRDPLLPGFSVVSDVLPGFESTQWWGVAAPAKTPAAIVKQVHAEIVKAMQTPDVREMLAKQGATTHAESPAEFIAFIKAERERIARVGRQVGITLD